MTRITSRRPRGITVALGLSLLFNATVLTGFALGLAERQQPQRGGPDDIRV